MSAEAWLAIAERAEQASGADRELDAAVKLAVAADLIANYGWVARPLIILTGDLYDDPHPYTASVDELRAIKKVALPGWSYEGFGGPGGHVWTLHEGNGFGKRSAEGRHPTSECLARLAAFARAKAAQEEGR